MKEIKELFVDIGKADVDESCTHLLANGVIDSLDIIALVGAIEKKYGKKLDIKYIQAENFINFTTLKAMIDEYLKG
jgi:acyl carrier protein